MTYNHKLINDLAWTIGSASLLDNFPFKDERLKTSKWYNEQLLDCKQLLDAQDKSPHLIQSYLSDMTSFRLGHYFEKLIAYWLLINPRFEIVHNNLVINQDKRTIGEIDFIIRDLYHNKTIHLEVAVKFYLQVKQDERSYWFGTNLNDRLDLKMDKLFNKQIELSNNEIAKEELAKQGIEIDDHWVIIKGRLFSKRNELINNSWFTNKEFSRLANDSKWIILDKSFWLADATNIDYNFLTSDIYNRSEITDIVTNKNNSRPLCVAEVINNRESKRIFITPENWNQQALDTLIEKT